MKKNKHAHQKKTTPHKASTPENINTPRQPRTDRKTTNETMEKTALIWTQEQWRKSQESSAKKSHNNTREKKIKRNMNTLVTEYKKNQYDGIIIGLINIQDLPKPRTGQNNFYPIDLIIDSKFDHIGLAKKSRYWTALKDNNRPP